MQNCAFSSKKKKGERERDGEAAVEEKGSLLSDGLGQFLQLVGIPDWQSPCLGFKQELRWLRLAPVSQQMPFSKGIFSECLSLRHLHIWRWMYHICFLKSWEIWKKKKNSKKPRRTKRETHWKDLICFEWVTNVQASWGCVHKGFCAIWIVRQGPWNRYKGNPRSPWAFQALMEAGAEVSKALCTLRLGASWGVCSSPPPVTMMMGHAAAWLSHKPPSESWGSATIGEGEKMNPLKNPPPF